jgi:hypothetical protein
VSHFLRDALDPILAEVIRPGALSTLFDDVEYRQAVLQWVRPRESRESWPYVGEYILESRWHDGPPPSSYGYGRPSTPRRRPSPRGRTGSAVAWRSLHWWSCARC